MRALHLPQSRLGAWLDPTTHRNGDAHDLDGVLLRVALGVAGCVGLRAQILGLRLAIKLKAIPLCAMHMQ